MRACGHGPHGRRHGLGLISAVFERQQVVGANTITLRLQVRTTFVLGDDHLRGVSTTSDMKLVPATNTVNGFVFGEALIETGVSDTADVSDALVSRVLSGAGDGIPHSVTSLSGSPW
jgi:hypothetical protein